MNTQQLIGWIKTPSSLGKEASAQLDTLTQTFPYFQTAHLLYIKSLHNENSFLYNNQLKVSAAYATNRKVLYELIIKKDANFLEIEAAGKKAAAAVEEEEKEQNRKTEIEKANVPATADIKQDIESKEVEEQTEIIQPDFPKKRFTKDEDEWESGMMRQLQLLHHWKTTPQDISAALDVEKGKDISAALDVEKGKGISAALDVKEEKAALDGALDMTNSEAPTAADEINTLLYVLVEPGEAED
ncbi:MAG: hypothetical protein M3R17_18245, partial [Bacteroidota bacterium]|nr:hypothetical protein [Bacteroidota bacterium]